MVLSRRIFWCVFAVFFLFLVDFVQKLVENGKKSAAF
jgi:hypothetical protein